MPSEYTDTGAVLSECGTYRYRLWREWRDAPTCLWIMLNPSTADAETDDATIRRCVGFADRWGAGRIEVVNLYPLRATQPRDLWEHPTPEGPAYGSANRAQIEAVLRGGVSRVVAGWGNNAPRGPAMQKVLLIAQRYGHVVSALGLTKQGHPRHPVRLPYSTQLEVFRDA